VTFDEIIAACAESDAGDWAFWMYVCDGGTDGHRCAAALFMPDRAIRLKWSPACERAQLASLAHAWPHGLPGPGSHRWVELLHDGTVLARCLAVQIEGERSGWFAVRTPDGTTGYVWQDNLAFDPGERPEPTFATTTLVRETVASSTSSTMVEYRPPPTPAVDEQIERLRAEVSRLATAEEELSRRLPRDPTPTAGSPSGAAATGDGSAGAAVLFLAGGAIIGWVLGRLVPSRRERRSRIRI